MLCLQLEFDKLESEDKVYYNFINHSLGWLLDLIKYLICSDDESEEVQNLVRTNDTLVVW